ncbi:MAG: NOB1 family endonuclease [Thermoproteota archaeon]
MEVDNKHTCFILDTNAILRGSILNFGQSKPIYTVSSSLHELKDSVKSFAVDALAQSGRLKVVDVDQRVKKLARTLARRSRDIRKLSDVDIELIALALYLRDKGEVPLFLTSDYAIQNVLAMAKIDFRAIGQRNIKNVVIWNYKCPICGKVYDMVDKCPVCGTKLIKIAAKVQEL